MTDMSNNGLGAGGAAVRFTSFNVKGLNGPIKRARIFAHLKKLNTDIAFLQETHLRITDQARLRKSWVGQVFHSNFNVKARGTAIIIHKKIQFTASNTISDPQGRFIMVSGFLFHTPVLLVNVYAPNWDDVGFVNTVISLLPNLNSQRLIFGGDLNCVIDPALDRSSPRLLSPSKMSKALSMFMNQSGCIDPWRFLFPDKKEFSFFSHAHHTYSRIDYFFLDKTLLPSVRKIEYSAIVESDHAPLLLDLSFTLNYAERPPWRFNTALLSDNAFCNSISTAIDNFLVTNKSDTVSPSTLWETLKVVIRGEIISYSSHLNKQRKIRQQQLIDSIRELDSQYSTSPSPEIYKERLDCHTEYNLLSTDKIEQQLLRSRGFVYEHGEKAGRLLAHQLKCQSASRLIPQIYNMSRELTVNPAEINNTFKSYYSDLYTCESPEDGSTMQDFFTNLDTPTISPDQKSETDRPLQLGELTHSIKAMQSGKSPGPDGYPIEFYKKFSDKLAPLLLEMFNDSLSRGVLPQTLTEASITLLLKPGKDSLECSGYRPISLLNSDVKILAKLLASRLELSMSHIISSDQTGFIKGRHSFSNVRRLLNIIHSPASLEVPEVIISLDAEKAFDRVEWDYLFSVLGKFGFGTKFISWIRLLYSSPKASVLTNRLQSRYFELFRGTRQGCPLSPLLFALAIEPLSIMLKATPSIHGIRRWGLEHKVSLYADDLLLYVSDPVACSPHIVDLLSKFGTFSGYRLNFSKSECFPLNNLALQLPATTLPFPMSAPGFRYLGINITRTLPALYSENFTPLVDKLKLDLQRWAILHLSLAGRVNCVKMNVLPRFLYLFQCLPVFLPKSFFSLMDKLISSFLWNGGVPRVRKAVLQRNRSDGGLALPNLMYYYWAANIHKVVYWIHFPDTDWCRTEAGSCTSSSLPALAMSKLPLHTPRYTSNPVVVSTLKIWTQFRQHFKLTDFSLFSPICNNHLFLPPTLDSVFSQWQERGLTKFTDLYINGIFASFEDLATKYYLPRSHLFRYFQIRRFTQAQSPFFPDLPPRSGLEKLLCMPPPTKGLVSHVLDIILSFSNASYDKTKANWEEEIGTGLSDEFWDKALRRVNGTSSCARLSLIQFKVLHRVHLSKARLAKIYPTVDGTCDRCKCALADLTHMFWSCHKLSDFWSTIFKTLSEALNLEIRPCVSIAVFGVPDDFIFRNNQLDVIAFASLLARRRILLNWKSANAPKASLWVRDLMLFLKLEKIKYTIRGSTGKFYLTWNPILNYFKKLESLPQN